MSEHHTREEITNGFAQAPNILNLVKAMGIESPRFVLYADASGKLILGDRTELTEISSETFKEIENLIGSSRYGLCVECLFVDRSIVVKEPAYHHCPVAIHFCDGLIRAGGEHDE